MAGPHSRRYATLKLLKHRGDDCVPVARCMNCGHRAGLPLDTMILRWGADYPVEHAEQRLRCLRCDSRGCRIDVARLCAAGCARQRG